jgi:hypothetical protein
MVYHGFRPGVLKRGGCGVTPHAPRSLDHEEVKAQEGQVDHLNTNPVQIVEPILTRMKTLKTVKDAVLGLS